jgi:uncharacterized protein (TIGR02687 family)
MDKSQIEKALNRLFVEENQRIVFWNDPAQEFTITLSLVDLPEGVNLIRLDQVGALEVKLLIEREDPLGLYLLYSPAEEPDYESDWLLDIRLYSRSFRADRASIILDQLGLSSQHLRDHIALRRKFFDDRQRLQKLQPLVVSNDTEIDLDRKMIAVVTRAEQAEWFTILRTLFHDYAPQGNGRDVDMEKPPACWLQIEKFDLDGSFWQMAKSLFGYNEENPSPGNLLLRLFASDFVHHLKCNAPSSLTHLVLPPTGTSNAVVFLAQWRDSSSKAGSYDRLSDAAGEILKIEDQIYGCEIEHVLDVMTFQVIEKRIAHGLRDRLLSSLQVIAADDIRKIASHRQAGHWTSPNVVGSPEVPRAAYYAVYNALVSAATFFELKNSHDPGAERQIPIRSAAEFTAGCASFLYGPGNGIAHAARKPLLQAQWRHSDGWAAGGAP